MPVVLNSNVITAPGVYVSESTAGIVPVGLASWNRCYMLGTSAQGEYNTPIQVISTDDFTNVFGSSTSLNAVTLFFRNHPNGVLFFVRCAAPQIAELTVSDAITGVWSIAVSIDGGDPLTVSYNYVDASPTVQKLMDGIIAAFNASAAATALLAYDPQPADSKFRIRGLGVDTVFALSGPTAPVGATLTKVDDITAPKDDFIWACENAFDPDEHEQGFLIAPQAFQSLANSADRVAVAVSMENFCSTEGFDWMALVDCGDAINTATQADKDIDLYTSVRGHMAYFFPYVKMIDVGNVEALVPPSPAVAAIGLRRYENEGFQQPPAGVPYALRGVTDVETRIKRQQQAVLNPQGVNVVRYLPNKGVVVYGSRTRSASPYYRFINTRIILNVLIGTLRNTFDQFIFTAVDGQGALFARVRETAESICYRMWDGGALFGASPADAFFVKVDRENNPDTDLEQGIVRLDVYVCPAPSLERLLISVARVAIGQIDIVTRTVA